MTPTTESIILPQCDLTLFSPYVSKQPTRPNTHIHYPVYTEHHIRMPAGQLKYAGWSKHTTTFPDREVRDAILGICQLGARIEYECARDSPTLYQDLDTALEDQGTVTKDLGRELEKARFEEYSHFELLPPGYTASPLGLTDKADQSTRRVHHLSYSPDHHTSINSQIPEHYGTIEYSTIDEAITAIQQYGCGCGFGKRDFESAYRHIPVFPMDSPLLGFECQGKYFAERYLPFGLRTALYLFNLFAKVFHWILADKMKSQGMQGEVIHYLDDSLIVLSANGNMNRYSRLFSKICEEVGLTIKEAKSEERTVASFSGVELDTAKMIIRLPTRKLVKAKKLFAAAVNTDALTLLELQTLTGFLNFICIVTPLGRTFVRRLYNMQIYFPARGGQHRRRISSEASKDLRWWLVALAIEPEQSIKRRDRETISLWSDAAGRKRLGTFYMDSSQNKGGGGKPDTRQNFCPTPLPSAAFSIPLPPYLRRMNEHINTKEIRAVEQALLYWGKQWQGKKVIMHIDNRAVVHGLENQTIRGSSMDVLRRCLLLATDHDLEIEARWIPTNANTLPDALSRFDYEKITNLAPQIIHPTSSLRDRGFLTYSKLGCRR